MGGGHERNTRCMPTAPRVTYAATQSLIFTKLNGLDVVKSQNQTCTHPLRRFSSSKLGNHHEIVSKRCRRYHVNFSILKTEPRSRVKANHTSYYLHAFMKSCWVTSPTIWPN